jgi:hypothetical protein
MSIHHSEETHRNLLSRIPAATGRSLDTWFSLVNDGPSLPRFEERVNWLRAEHDLPRGYANAIVHEMDLKRAARAFG